MSGHDPIQWDHDDPITAAARQAVESATSTADRAFQSAYMIQVMRTQRTDNEADELGELGEAAADQGGGQRVERALAAGDRVKAGDRGNVGVVVSIEKDTETALVRFTNTQTSATKAVRLPLSKLNRLTKRSPPPGGSGLIRPSGKPDPTRIKQTRTERAKNQTRPAGWKQNPQPKRRRPPKPKP